VPQFWTRCAGISGFLAVAAGAFGAHVLKDRLGPELLVPYQTGALYHLVHSVVLLALALYQEATGKRLGWGATFLTLGMILFSGSLYLLAVTGVRGLGAVTPIGGVCLLIGWLLVGFRLTRD
jgi:uncharacterized membrane protein YgdD (TMEM256/DUF423 family)